MSESTKWALLIGIDRYHESLGSLKYAGADCRALRETLVSGPLGFPEDQVLLLDDSEGPDRRPTFANIHSYLGSWLAAPKPDDLVVVYFAGHGRLVDGKTYLVPGDATLASIHTLGIPLPQVQDVLERCRAKRKLLVLDACHSGSGRDVAAMPDGMAAALAAGTGFYTISSCGAEERSHEWDEIGHGVFSHFLTEALRGGCSPAADGRLTVDGVYEWVHDRVAKWAALHRCAQTPQRFARGAGTLVLTQSAPDYAVLAEQYRREAEEAKARLAEAELRDTRNSLEQRQAAVRKAKMDELATSFLRTNRKLHGAALFRKFKKHVTDSAGFQSDDELKAALTNARNHILETKDSNSNGCSEIVVETRFLRQILRSMPWQVWLWLSLLLPVSAGIAVWGRAALKDTDGLSYGYFMANGLLLMPGFGVLIGLFGHEFCRWSQGRAVLIGVTASICYLAGAVGAHYFWPAALFIPVSAVALTYFRSSFRLMLLIVSSYSIGLAAWANAALKGTVGLSEGYFMANGLLLMPGFGVLIGLFGKEFCRWPEGRAVLIGALASAYYLMAMIGAYFAWPIALLLPLSACLLLIPAENEA